MKNTLAQFTVAIAVLVSNVSPTSATLLGKSIDAELYTVSGSIISVETQFTTPSLIATPGIEFNGVIRIQQGLTCPNNGCLAGVEIDFDDTGFTIRATAVDNFTHHNGSQFGVRLFNLPDNVTDIVEFVGVGFEAEVNVESNGTVFDLRYSGWSIGSVDRYGFEFAPDPVPEPATLAIFGFALAGVGVMRRRKRGGRLI